MTLTFGQWLLAREVRGGQHPNWLKMRKVLVPSVFRIFSFELIPDWNTEKIKVFFGKAKMAFGVRKFCKKLRKPNLWLNLGAPKLLWKKAAARQTLTHTWHALMHTRICTCTLSITRTPIHALSHTHAGILESKPGAKKQVTPFSVDRFRFTEKPIKKNFVDSGVGFQARANFFYFHWPLNVV